MIKVVAKNFFKKEKINEVTPLLRELVEKTLKENGCIKYELFVNIKDSSVFTIIEEWENIEDLNNHMVSEHFKRIVPLLSEFMVKNGEIDVYKKFDFK